LASLNQPEPTEGQMVLLAQEASDWIQNTP
jgi:hypothetical protein